MGLDIGTLTAHLGLDTSGLSAGEAQFKSSIGHMSDGIGALKGALAELGMAVGVMALAKSVAEIGTQIDTSLTKIEAITGATGDRIGAISKAARDAGYSTQYGFAAGTGALAKFADEGMNARDSISLLPQAMDFSTAHSTTLANSVDTVTESLRKWERPVGDAGAMLDALTTVANRSKGTLSDITDTINTVAPAAHALGYSFEETAAMVGALADKGVVGERAAMGLRMAMVKSNDVAVQYGLTNSNLAYVMEWMGKQGKSTSEVFKEFGARQGVVAAALKGTSGSVNEYREAIAGADGATHRMAETMGTSLENTFARLKATVSTVAGEVFAPIGEDLKKMMGEAIGWIAGHKEEVTAFIRTLLQGIEAVVSILMRGVAILSPILVPVLRMTDQITRGIADVVGGFGGSASAIQKADTAVAGLGGSSETSAGQLGDLSKEGGAAADKIGDLGKASVGAAGDVDTAVTKTIGAIGRLRGVPSTIVEVGTAAIEADVERRLKEGEDRIRKRDQMWGGSPEQWKESAGNVARWAGGFVNPLASFNLGEVGPESEIAHRKMMELSEKELQWMRDNPEKVRANSVALHGAMVDYLTQLEGDTKGIWKEIASLGTPSLSTTVPMVKPTQMDPEESKKAAAEREAARRTALQDAASDAAAGVNVYKGIVSSGQFAVEELETLWDGYVKAREKQIKAEAALYVDKLGGTKKAQDLASMWSDSQITAMNTTERDTVFKVKEVRDAFVSAAEAELNSGVKSASELQKAWDDYFFKKSEAIRKDESERLKGATPEQVSAVTQQDIDALTLKGRDLMLAKEKEINDEEMSNLQQLLSASTTTTKDLRTAWSAYEADRLKGIDSEEKRLIDLGVGYSKVMEIVSGMHKELEHEKVSTIGTGMEKAWADRAKSMQATFGELFFDSMKGRMDDFKDYWKNFVDSLERTLADDVAKMVVDWVAGLGKMENSGGGLGGVAGWVGKLFGYTSPSVSELSAGNPLDIAGQDYGEMPYRFAAGGIVTRPTRALVGEAGPEAVIPLRQMPVTKPNFSGSTSPSIVVHMNVQTPDVRGFKESQGQILSRMSVALQQAMARSV